MVIQILLWSLMRNSNFETVASRSWKTGLGVKH